MEIKPNQLYQDFGQWQNKQAKVTNEQDYTAFDIMQGKNPENDRDYFTQIFSLAQGELTKYDKNEDGTVSYDEFKAKEKEETEKDLGEKYANMLTDEDFEPIFGIIDNDGSSQITLNEFALPYWAADQLDGKDGMINYIPYAFTLEELSKQDPNLIKEIQEILNYYSPYIEKYADLANIKFDELDKDLDNTISETEYILGEIGDISQYASKDEALNAITNAKITYQFIDEAFGTSNCSGKIDFEEMLYYYKNFDSLMDGAENGKIDISQDSAFKNLFGRQLDSNIYENTKNTYSEKIYEALTK